MSDAQPQFLSRRERLAAERAAAANETQPSTAPADASYPQPTEYSEPIAQAPAEPIAPERPTHQTPAGPPSVPTEPAVMTQERQDDLDTRRAQPMRVDQATIAQVLGTDPADASIAETPQLGVEEDDVSGLFQYDVPAAATIGPTVAAAPTLSTDDEEDEYLPIPDDVKAKANLRRGKNADGSDEDKGINLWAVFAGLAALVSLASIWVQPLQFAGPYIGLGGIPIAVIAILLPKFKRIQSIVALVLAVGVGGFQGYTTFIAPPVAAPVATHTAAPVAKDHTITLAVTGQGTPTLAYIVQSGPDTIKNTVPNAKLPWSADVKVPTSIVLPSVVIQGPRPDTPLTCTVSYDGHVVYTNTPGLGVPFVCRPPVGTPIPGATSPAAGSAQPVPHHTAAKPKK